MLAEPKLVAIPAMPPTISFLPVKDLKIDLKNYRTRETTNEVDAVHALIALRPHYFWDLMKSLIEDGYHGTENILVLEADGKKNVREGNRRIGAMKIIHELLPRAKFEIPEDVQELLNNLPAAWKKENESVPSRVYPELEADAVNRLVRLTHGRGESAGRLNWEAIARSRFNRDVAKGNEPGLDLLETYLENAKKLTDEERERWGGDYPLTVLDEALQKVAQCYSFGNAREVVDKMDATPGLAKALGPIVHDIGTEVLHTRDLRNSSWGTKYGLPTPPPKGSTGGSSGTGSTGGSSGAGTGGTSTSTSSGGGTEGAGAGSAGAAPSAGGGAGGTTPPARGKRRPTALDDPRSPARDLKRFTPAGTTSSKLVNLRDEAVKLKLDKTPIAFCFLLRSMFELSARAYCLTNKIPQVHIPKKKGDKPKDKSLAELLSESATHLIARRTDPTVIGKLRNADTEIKNKSSILSVTGMNQLVHAPNIIITPQQAAIGFHKIFPLLEELNR